MVSTSDDWGRELRTDLTQYVILDNKYYDSFQVRNKQMFISILFFTVDNYIVAIYAS